MSLGRIWSAHMIGCSVPIVAGGRFRYGDMKEAAAGADGYVI
jgi:hypothetical protein